MGILHCPQCACIVNDQVAEWRGASYGEATSVCGECAGYRFRYIHQRPLVSLCQGNLSDPYTVALHLGFLCITETPEQLALLRKTPGEKESGKRKVAVSKIETTVLSELRPIDRVAARVVQS